MKTYSDKGYSSKNRRGDVKTSYSRVTAQFGSPVDVEGSSFDVVVTYEGTGLVTGSIIATN